MWRYLALSPFPRIAVVTVCLNSATTIERTLRSVAAQTWPAIEHVIIDGGSTDGTLDVIRKHQSRVSRLVSEPDGGIYDAMNKGIRSTQADILYFLNSDDELFGPTVIEDVAKCFVSHPAVVLVYGDVIYATDNGTTPRRFNRVTRRNLIYRDLCHQAVFARRQLFETIGYFDLRYSLNADYDWLLRVFLSGARTMYLERDVALFNAAGRHMANVDRLRAERQQVRLNYMGSLRFAVGNFMYRVKEKLWRWWHGPH